jgi:protein-L-isoaspartate(D-aspartate) O-methyltransferase
MIKQQLRTGDVLDETILALYDKFPRKMFVPTELSHFAYTDQQLALPHGERMMTPLEEGLLLKALNLQGHETVLEIGTGTGFLTALLSQLCKKVISVDYYPEFTASARKKLSTHGCQNVELHTGDGSLGWLNQAPYDVILFTGAIDCITKTHQLQVLPGGKLFAIVGSAPVMQGQLHTLDHQNQWHEKLIFETNLPSLVHTQKQNQFVF